MNKLIVVIKPIITKQGYTFNRVVLVDEKTSKEVFDLTRCVNSAQKGKIKSLIEEVK